MDHLSTLPLQLVLLHSLNQSGLQVISSKPNLLGVLSWLLQGRYINGVCMHVCVSSVVRVCSVSASYTFM